MRERIVSALAAVTTIILFGSLGFLVGCTIALIINAISTITSIGTMFSLTKSGCVAFIITAALAACSIYEHNKQEE